MGDKETLLLFIVTMCFIFFGLQPKIVEVADDAPVPSIMADASASANE